MQKAANNYRTWRRGELDFLRANPNVPVKKLAEMLQRTDYAVAFKRRQLGIKRGSKTVKMDYSKECRQTLCARCGTSILRCPWLRWLKPVPGWLATPTIVESHSVQIDSFCVHECPLYESEAKNRKREAVQC